MRGDFCSKWPLKWCTPFLRTDLCTHSDSVRKDGQILWLKYSIHTWYTFVFILEVPSVRIHQSDGGEGGFREITQYIWPCDLFVYMEIHKFCLGYRYKSVCCLAIIIITIQSTTYKCLWCWNHFLLTFSRILRISMKRLMMSRYSWMVATMYSSGLSRVIIIWSKDFIRLFIILVNMLLECQRWWRGRRGELLQLPLPSQLTRWVMLIV